MLITSTAVLYVIYLFKHFFSKDSLPKILLIFNNLVSFQISIMSKTSSNCLKSLERSWHIYTSNSDNISWRTFSSVYTSSNNSHLSWNMSNWYLFRWFLNLYFLITNEFAGFNLHNKLTFSLVCNTLNWRTFYFRCEFFWVDYLIDFKTTNITSIYSNLNAWLDITYSCNYSFYHD